MLKTWRRALLVAVALHGATAAHGETVTVAVASNFSVPLAALAADFERDTGHELRVVTGSTGRLYAQIVNGAPFDVFLAADAERPARLEADSHTVPDSRFTYAVGILVLWSADPSVDDCLRALNELGSRRLAIANPRLAPYGRAAMAFLKERELWDAVQPALVTGENVAQVAQFVATRNAALGFIAKSQFESLPARPSCRFELPPGAHPGIDQQAVQLRRSAGNRAAAAFLDFLKTAAVRRRLVELGYRSFDAAGDGPAGRRS